MKPYTTTGLDAVNTYCDDTKNVISLNPLKKFTRLSQGIMNNRVQGRKGEAYLNHNRTDKTQCCKFNYNYLALCILICNHTSLDISRVYSGNHPNIMVCRKNDTFIYGRGGDKLPKTDLGVPHCSKFPYTDILNFKLLGSIFCATYMETIDYFRNVSRGSSMEEF